MEDDRKAMLQQLHAGCHVTQDNLETIVQLTEEEDVMPEDLECVASTLVWVMAGAFCVARATGTEADLAGDLQRWIASNKGKIEAARADDGEEPGVQVLDEPEHGAH